MTKNTYFHSHFSTICGDLVDRGVNGGICGDELMVINKKIRKFDLRGIDNYQFLDIPILPQVQLHLHNM